MKCIKRAFVSIVSLGTIMVASQVMATVNPDPSQLPKRFPVAGMAFDYGLDLTGFTDTNGDGIDDVYQCTVWSDQGKRLGTSTWTRPDSSNPFIVDVDIHIEKTDEHIVLQSIDLSGNGAVGMMPPSTANGLLDGGLYDSNTPAVALVAFDAVAESGSTFKGETVVKVHYRCANEMSPNFAFAFCRYCTWVFEGLPGE